MDLDKARLYLCLEANFTLKELEIAHKKMLKNFNPELNKGKNSIEFRNTIEKAYLTLKKYKLDESLNSQESKNRQLFLKNKKDCVNIMENYYMICPSEYHTFLSQTIDVCKKELEAATNNEELIKIFKDSRKDVKEKIVNIEIITIKNNLINRFMQSYRDDDSLQMISPKSEILSLALNYLELISKEKISVSKLSYLNEISFKDTENDHKILDFVIDNPTADLLPIEPIPILKNGELETLYGKIKPVIDINGKKFRTRKFSLQEVKDVSLILDKPSIITTSINNNCIEEIGHIECYSEPSYDKAYYPKTSDVLSQIPPKYLDRINAFEIVDLPVSIYDAFKSYTKKNVPTYHKSKVKLYNLK